MNLRQLYYFRTIAEPEHYTQAAEKLYVSQSNLSHAIQEMEEELNVKERAFVGFLVEKKYIYRDKKGKLMPYEAKNNGLFEVKECYNEKTQWSGTQTMVTPKGRETFRLLMQGL